MKKNELKDRLSRFRQIKLTVIGRNSGNAISNPVWFVAASIQWAEQIMKQIDAVCGKTE
jgi:hypothetical protein